MNNMRNKILSLLVLLLTAATGARAQSSHTYTDLRDQIGTGGDITLSHDYYKYDSGDPIEITNSGVIDGNGAIIDMEGASISHVFYISVDNVTIKNLSIINYTGTGDAIYFSGSGGSVYNIGYDVALRPGTTNTWTITMPASDVLLTPIYAAASILHQVDEETVTSADFASLKEAFAAVQDGDVITLEWNVTLEEDLATPTIQNGAKFIIDFNGYTLDCGTNNITLTNAGDELTFKDLSGNEKPGGLKTIELSGVNGAKFIFDSGRYTFNDATAQEMNDFCASFDNHELADGKEFVAIENAPVDGFTMIIGYAAFELTVAPGRFATFFDNNNLELVEPTEGVTLYTITSISDDRSKAYVSALTGIVDGNSTPLLVYNGTANPVTVKLKPTDDDANDANPESADEFMGTDEEPQQFTATDMAAKDYFVLSGGKAFAPVYGTGTLAAHKAYLEFEKAGNANTQPGSSDARTITIVFEGETTGITNTDRTDRTDDAIYDLNGRKLNAAPKRKGVYINNGQKVVK